MGVRIRFRTDSPDKAEDAARLERGEDMLWHRTKRELGRTPPARHGDTWRVTWARTVAERRRKKIPALAGYAICCPKCNCVHWWTSANNCGTRRIIDGLSRCDHTGVGSCWSWTGEAKNGTLSASPSLHSDASRGGCGWHGFLTNGELVGG